MESNRLFSDRSWHTSRQVLSRLCWRIWHWMDWKRCYRSPFWAEEQSKPVIKPRSIMCVMQMTSSSLVSRKSYWRRRSNHWWRLYWQHVGCNCHQKNGDNVYFRKGSIFWGQNVRKYHGKMLIKPSKKNLRAHLQKIRGIVRGNLMARQDVLIHQLNPVIRRLGELSSFNVVAKETWQLWDWGLEITLALVLLAELLKTAISWVKRINTFYSGQ